MKTDQAELPEANSRSSTLEQKKNSGLLMFVDTNIFLQAYAHPDVRVPLLEELMSISERIICSEQLAMEFMKNRQQKIRDSLKSLKLELPTPPGFFAGSSTLSDWEDHKQKTKAKFEQLKTSLNDAIEDPVKNDRVFAVVQNLVQKSSLLRLTKLSHVWNAILQRAKERWGLGYPPRKASDTSIGDALHWEWIVECAMNTKQSVLVVSADSDWGEKTHVNDWLKKEFSERVGKGVEIRLTNLLARGLQEMGVKIPSEQVEREEKATEAFDKHNLWTKQFPWWLASSSGEAPKVYVVTDPSSIIPIPKFDPGTSFLE